MLSETLEQRQLLAAGDPVQILDDADAGFSTTGTYNPNSGGFGSGLKQSHSAWVASTASWTFDVSPGTYEVAASWPGRSNSATDTPFSVFDGSGGTALGAGFFDQTKEPNDFVDANVGWESLGPFSVTGNTIEVQTSNAVTAGYAIADAVRIQRVAPISVSETQLGAVASRSHVGFGITGVGQLVDKTFTLTNDSSAAITLDPLSPPQGFSIVNNFTAGQTLAAGGSVNFTVRLDATIASKSYGPLSIVVDDGADSLFEFTISGTTLQPGSAVQVVDDGDAGFFYSGTFYSIAGGGLNGSMQHSHPSWRDSLARWVVDVEPGTYQVAATWPSSSARAVDTPFTIYDGVGGVAIATSAVDQSTAPREFVEAGTAWDSLDEVTVTGNTLVIELANGQAAGYSVADAIRVQRLADVSVSEATLGSVSQGEHVGFGVTEVGSPIEKTFTLSNDSTDAVLLNPITVPTGFTVVNNFQGSQSLSAGQTIDFTVRLDAGADTKSYGRLQMVIEDDASALFDFGISGTVTSSAVQEVGKFDDGFVSAGKFQTVSVGHFGSALKSHVSYEGSRVHWVVDVQPGRYEVAVSWPGFSGNAPDAPFTVYDGVGGTALATMTVDQTGDANDFVDGMTGWEVLGDYTITGNTLVVDVTNAIASGFAVADAVRIQRLADVTFGEAFGQPIGNGKHFGFGAADVGGTISKTFTLTNDGSESIELSPVSVPAGFTVAYNFSAGQMLAAGESINFVVQFDGSVEAKAFGELSIEIDNGAPSLFWNTISGTALPAPGVLQYLDNDETGFLRTGLFSTGLGAYGNDQNQVHASWQGSRAIWVFDVQPGTYQVAATWLPLSIYAPDTPFTVYDGVGGAALGTKTMDQTVAPDDFSDGGADWETVLGSFDITSNTLMVNLTNVVTTGYAAADAVRIERVFDSSGVRDSVRTIAEDAEVALRSSDFHLFEYREEDIVGIRVHGIVGGTLRFDGLPVAEQTFLTAKQISDGRVTWQSDPDLYGDHVAGFKFDWVAAGVTRAWSLQHSIRILPVADQPTANPPQITLDEDEQHRFAWTDLGIADGDVEQPDSIRLSSLPTLGTLLIDGAAASVGETITRSQFDDQAVRYVPGLDESGVGSDSFGFVVLDPEGVDSEIATLDLVVVSLTAEGTWRLDVRDSNSGLVTSADVGQTVTAELVGTSHGFFTDFRGGYVDLTYDAAVLQLQGSIQYPSPFTSGDGFESLQPGHIGNLGSYNETTSGQGSSSVLATLTFLVVSSGDAGLQIRPSTNSSLDPFLTHDDDAFSAGQVDHAPISFVGVDPSSGNLPSPSGGGNTTPSTVPKDPYEFVERLTGNPQRDTTPRKATEPNAVFRDTPEHSRDLNSPPNFRPTDVAYYRIDQVLGSSNPDSVSSPIIKVTDASNDLYTLGPPVYSLGIINAAIFDGSFSLGDPTKFPAGTPLDTTEWYYPVTNKGGPLDFDIYRNTDNNEANLGSPTELTLEIVYEHGFGDYQSTPPNAAAAPGNRNETATIDDPVEVLTITADDNARALEYDPAQTPPGPAPGLIQIEVQPISPVIPAGISGQSEIALHSEKNYLETEIRLILEVPSDGNGGVAEHYATPGVDFTLAKKLRGHQYDGTNVSETSDPLDDDVYHPLTITQAFQLPGAKAGYLYYIVSDIPSTQWIDVSAVVDTFDSSIISLWNQVDIIVTPLSDVLDEGTETFTAYLETNVAPDPGAGGIGWESTLTPELTTFIHYDEVDVSIDDVPSGEPEIERDGLCSCTCDVCASPGLPVNMFDGSATLHPLGASPDSSASFGPSYHSPGASSTQGTARVSFPFSEIASSGSGVLPDPYRIDLSLAIEGGVFDGTDGRQSVLADIGQAGALPDQHAFTLQLPDDYGTQANEDSVAVRIPTLLNTSDVGSATATPTGPYRATITANAVDENQITIGRWTGQTTVLVNNLQQDYQLAPGWEFPFENQLIVGTIGGGEVGRADDQGAALLRANQTSSWFATDALISPPEVFSQLLPAGQGYQLVEPDGSKQVFELSSRPTATTAQTAYIMTESHDSAGNVTHIDYDGSGRVTKVTDPWGRATLFDWAAFTPPADSSDPPDDSTIENHLRITDWRNRTTHYEYHVFSDSRNPYLVIRHPQPDDSGSLNPTDGLIEIYQYDSHGYVDSVRRGSKANPANADAHSQTTTISYQSYLHSDQTTADQTLRRVATVTNPDNSTFTINQIGIQDALVGGDLSSWRSLVQWNQFPPSLDRTDIMGPYWANQWREARTPGSPNDPDGTVDGIDPAIFVATAKTDLRSFDNYAAYTINQTGSAEPRRFEFTLDRRGRVTALEDPQGNLTEYERTVVYSNSGGGNATDLVLLDRGEVTKVTAPDPDVRLNDNQTQVIFNGPLGRPVTTYEYQPGTPFVVKTNLPDTQSSGGPVNLVWEYEEFVHGQPQIVTDELGLTTHFQRDDFGVPQRIYVNDTPEPSRWVNSLDAFNVNADANVSALDALVIINELFRKDGDFQVVEPRPPQSVGFYDVSDDGSVTALDALHVINELNRSGGARPASFEYRSTELVYVHTERYDELASQLASQIGVSVELIDQDFNARNLPGAEIVRTARSEVGDQLTFYTYYLADSALPYHGQVKAIYQTNYLPADGSADFTNASVTSFTYDPTDGFLSSVVDPINRTTQYEFDDLGRPLKVTTPDPDGAGGPLSPTLHEFSYDIFGNLFQQQVQGDTWDTFSDAGTTIEQTALTTYAYDRRNRLTVIAQPHPDSVLAAQNETPAFVDTITSSIAQLETPADGKRPVTRLQYNTFDELTTVQNAENETFTYQYDLRSRQVKETSPQVDVFSWDPTSGAALTPDQALETDYSYYTDGNLHSVTDAEGLQSIWSYDGWHRPLSTQIERSSVGLHQTTWSYETIGTAGEPLVWRTVQNEFAGVGSDLLAASAVSVDSFGRTVDSVRLLEDSDSDNVFDLDTDAVATMSYQYYADDLLKSVTDPRGNSTGYRYDALSRLSAVRGAAVVENRDHDTSASAPAFQTEQVYLYDSAHQLRFVIDPTGIVTESTYDQLGNLDQLQVYTDAVAGDGVLTPGTVTEKRDYDFDGFSRLVHEIRGDRNDSLFAGSASNDFSIQSSFYDQLGRVQTRQEGIGPESGSTQLEYDNVHRTTKLIDPNQNETAWSYDDLGRVISESIQIGTQANPTSVSRTYFYDSLSNLVQSVDRNGRLIRYDYDDLHLLQTERWYAPAANPSDPTDAGALQGGYDYDFDTLGRLVSIAEMTQPAAEHRYEYRYDEGSRLVAELQTFAGSWTGGNQSIGFERDYDAYDNLTETRAFRDASFSVGGQSIDTTTSSDDYVDTRLYDAQNRLESITRGADVADGIAALHVTFGYDNAGRQSRVNRYHGSDDSAGVSWNTVLDYDEAGRLTTITHSDPLDSVNPLSVYERLFSQAGAIESTTVTLGTTEHLTKTYSQDNRGQVISESYFSGSSPSSQHTTRSYGPDAAGNRALEVIQSQTHHHTIDRDNRLVSDSRWSYTHDDEGNVTSKTSADGKSLWQYAWDHRNRLIEATLRYDASGNVSAASSITRTVSQTYDGLDRWIGSENSETGEKRLYVYDSGQLTLEFVDGEVENRYLWADGVDQLLAEDGAAVSEEPRWTLTDHLGSVRDVVSETTSLSHTDYDAFGNVEGTAADLLFGYTARPHDESTNLQNNHHRWYDSEIGRWINQDPSGLEPDANPYRYVSNQPMTLTDPSGLEPPVEQEPWYDDSGWDYLNPFAYNFPIGQRSIVDGVFGTVYSWGPTSRAIELDRQIAKRRQMEAYNNPQCVDIEKFKDTYRLSDAQADRVRLYTETGIQVNATILGGAALRPRGPVHIDIGGEGRYPRATNVNPEDVTSTTGTPGRPIPNRVPGRGERLPFGTNHAEGISVENTPVSAATAAEIARVIKPGGSIRLLHWYDYASVAHQRVIDAVGEGCTVVQTTKNNYTTTVITVPK